MIKQTLILRSQNEPILLIKSISFDLNKLNITVENIGNGPAYSIAVGTQFVPSKQKFFLDAEKTQPISVSQIKNVANQGKQVYSLTRWEKIN